MKNLNDFSKEIYEGNKLRGFDVAKENIGQSLMLVVSELSEALEADRINKHANLKSFEHKLKKSVIINNPDLCSAEISPDTAYKAYFEYSIKDSFEDEIADAIIRLFDLCGGLGIDIESHIKYKLEYNSKRQFKHGKSY